MPRTRFVILSTARSGTSHIGSMLRKTQGVFMHGEIFHRDVSSHVREEYRNARDVTLRERSAAAYVEDILNFVPADEAHVGFKHFRGESLEACRYVLRQAEVRKIILERKNRLAA